MKRFEIGKKAPTLRFDGALCKHAVVLAGGDQNDPLPCDAHVKNRKGLVTPATRCDTLWAHLPHLFAVQWPLEPVLVGMLRLSSAPWAVGSCVGVITAVYPLPNLIGIFDGSG